MDPITALAAFAPLVMDFGKGLISRFIAPETFRPSNVGEWLQMRASDVELFKAMNDNGPGPGLPWVDAVVRMQRPVVAGIVLAVWAWSHVAGFSGDAIDNFAGAVGFYLFGDRTLFHRARAAAPATGGGR